jgi:VIT1/CCC1 family predicted Fe2+/Mn2+ transporter
MTNSVPDTLIFPRSTSISRSQSQVLSINETLERLMVVGARLMAAGKYVSVRSQSDTENADLTRERLELATLPEDEWDELAAIYVGRGLDESLARQVAIQLTSHDAPGAHARDELGISGLTNAQTVQAPLASAASFAVGAALPLAATFLTPVKLILWTVSISSLVFLAILGGVSASTGGAPVRKAVRRITFWGVLAMGATAAIESMFGVAV